MAGLLAGAVAGFAAIGAALIWRASQESRGRLRAVPVRDEDRKDWT